VGARPLEGGCGGQPPQRERGEEAEGERERGREGERDTV
jgi:hypothetical protein